MVIDELKKQVQALALQRAQLKDQLEQIEKTLQVLNFGMQVLEADQKAKEAPADAVADDDEM